MGWFITLGILVLLAILPLGVRLTYDSGGVVVKILVGFLNLQVFPMKKKEPKGKKEKPPKAKKKAAAAGKPAAKKEKEGSITDFLPFVQLAIDLLRSFRRKLRVDCLELKMIMAGGDPYALAMNYGKTWAAVGSLWPLLEEMFVIRKRNINIQCDFASSQSLTEARLDITITLGRLLALVFVYGVRALKEFLIIMNKRKGGAAT